MLGASAGITLLGACSTGTVPTVAPATAAPPTAAAAGPRATAPPRSGGTLRVGRIRDTTRPGGPPPGYHRDLVRCEYYDALDEPHRSFATMYRDRRWKLNVYHGRGLGELYDLEHDPHEFDGRWDDPAYGAIKVERVVKSFDATVGAMEYRPVRITPY
jgi:hypothetical protein